MAIQIFYRYRINPEVEIESMQIAGIDMNKGWKDFDRIQDVLTPFIRTKENPDAYLDFETYKPLTKEVLNNSQDYTKISEIYTRNELLLMDRKQLVEVAKSYNIDPVNKVNDFLLKLIYKAQEERVQAKIQTNWNTTSTN